MHEIAIHNPNRNTVLSGPDQRAVFLLRAAALQILVAAGEIELDDAIDRLAPSFEAIRPCICTREIEQRLAQYRPTKSRQRAAA